MEQSTIDADRLVEQKRSSYWQRFWQRLGAIAMLGRREDNGSVDTQSSGPPSNLTRAVDQVVDKAIEQADDEAKFEADSDYNSVLARPLPLGPQRYRNPAVWNPDPRLKAPQGSDERKAAERNPLDLTRDEHYEDVLKLIDDLSSRSGLDAETS